MIGIKVQTIFFSQFYCRHIFILEEEMIIRGFPEMKKGEMIMQGFQLYVPSINCALYQHITHIHHNGHRDKMSKFCKFCKSKWMRLKRKWIIFQSRFLKNRICFKQIKMKAVTIQSTFSITKAYVGVAGGHSRAWNWILSELNKLKIVAATAYIPKVINLVDSKQLRS